MTQYKENKKTADEQFAEEIIARLEAGTTPWQREWAINEAYREEYHNCVSGKEYHGANILRLFIVSEMRGYDDRRFITYQQAKDKGWQVRRGEKGTQITFWKAYKQEAEDEGEEDKIRFAHRVYTVFNAAQVDGMPELPPAATYDWDPIELGEQILENSKAVIKYDGKNRAFYRTLTDDIHLPAKENFKDAGGFYATAIHELAHWTKTAERLNREKIGEGIEAYAREELRAEIASWMISAATGLPFSPDNHAAYVAGWIECIKKDHREIFRACADAEKIKDYILGFLPKKEQEVAA